MRILVLAFSLALVLPGTTAYAAHVDILVSQTGGALVTGTFDFGPPAVAAGPERVFESEFDGFGASDEPGFNAVASGLPVGWSPLPASTDISFTIAATAELTYNLAYWDGVGSVSFGAVPDGEQLVVSKQTGPFTFLTAIADGGTNDVPGYVIDPTAADGGLHKHLDYFLLGDGSATPDAASAGIYVMGIRLSMAGLSDSLPAFIVFNAGLDEEAHEAAVEYMATIVPEPGTMLLVVAGLAGLAVHGRRRIG